MFCRKSAGLTPGGPGPGLQTQGGIACLAVQFGLTRVNLFFYKAKGANSVFLASEVTGGRHQPSTLHQPLQLGKHTASCPNQSHHCSFLFNSTLGRHCPQPEHYATNRLALVHAQATHRAGLPAAASAHALLTAAGCPLNPPPAQPSTPQQPAHYLSCEHSGRPAGGGPAVTSVACSSG